MSTAPETAPDPARASTEPTPIRSLSVLPARREDVELHTADGLTLVGELALPADRDPRCRRSRRR